MLIEILKIVIFYAFIIASGVFLTRLSSNWSSPRRRIIMIGFLGIGSIVLIKLLGITADPLSRVMFHGSLFMLMMSAVIYSLFSWYEALRGVVNTWIKFATYCGVFAAIVGVIIYANNAGVEALGTAALIFQIGFILALIGHAVVTYLRIRQFTDLMKQ